MLNHDNEIMNYLIHFTISNNFSNINKNLIYVLFKHSISYEKLFDNQSINMKDKVEPNSKIPIIKELLLTKDTFVNINLNSFEIENLLKNLCIF